MQCEFSKDELIDLDFAIMDRAIKAKQTLQQKLNLNQENNERLEGHIKKLDALHDKLLSLIYPHDKGKSESDLPL